jgi:hypothetical protein
MEKLTFACVADAVAHYYALGFTTWDECDDARIMRKNDEEVLIKKVGFLDVTASRIRLSGI